VCVYILLYLKNNLHTHILIHGEWFIVPNKQTYNRIMASILLQELFLCTHIKYHYVNVICAFNTLQIL